MTALPAWIDRETWEAFKAMRKVMKKPMTDFAEALILKTLYQLRDKGHDPNQALERSIVNNWLDVFEPKQKVITDMNPRETFQSEPARTPEERARDIAARDAVMANLKLVRQA